MKLMTDVEEDTFNDWRLPTIGELTELVDYDSCNPAIVSGIKDVSTSGYYWSSTSYVSSPHDAWYVDFHNGYTYYDYKNYGLYVRYVRDGVDGLEWSASSVGKMNWQEAKEYAKALVAPVYYKAEL